MHEEENKNIENLNQKGTPFKAKPMNRANIFRKELSLPSYMKPINILKT